MSKQDQFLEVVDRDTADARFRAVLALDPLDPESAPLEQAMGRVLAEDIRSQVNVPSFDRSNVDGFAVRAADTFGAREEAPRELILLDEVIATAVVPSREVGPGQAVVIATGGMAPRGADAVVMVEHTDTDEFADDIEDDETPRFVRVRRAVTPGSGLSFAGVDIAAGETVLRKGQLLTSRETGVLAAIGEVQVAVIRKPRIAVISTGDEIIAPGAEMKPGLVYDSNARILCDAIREAGGEPVAQGIVRDNLDALRQVLDESLASCDGVVLSGGTSKGEGDLCYRVVAELDQPGIVAHGVALKPGKPICLAGHEGKMVVILPGFPTSAIFTFHEFVAPVIRQLAGLRPESRDRREARMAVRINSEIGRTEYLLVGLAAASNATDSANSIEPQRESLSAYPMGKGSGSVTTFSKADGFVVIPREREIVEAGETVFVQLLGRNLQLADLHVIGSHCIGLDRLLAILEASGWRTKSLYVGSTAGLAAAERGECDLAGIHLLDPASQVYNRPLLSERVVLIPGYARMQGLIHRRGDSRFEGKSTEQLRRELPQDKSCMMVNRNQGSGTRVLIDQWLEDNRPNGYAVQSRSHSAVAAAVAQERADWGVAIEIAARQAGLAFIPLAEERYDFVTPADRYEMPAVKAFRNLLGEEAIRRELSSAGFRFDDD